MSVNRWKYGRLPPWFTTVKLLNVGLFHINPRTHTPNQPQHTASAFRASLGGISFFYCCSQIQKGHCPSRGFWIQTCFYIWRRWRTFKLSPTQKTSNFPPEGWSAELAVAPDGNEWSVHVGPLRVCVQAANVLEMNLTFHTGSARNNSLWLMLMLKLVFVEVSGLNCDSAAEDELQMEKRIMKWGNQSE